MHRLSATSVFYTVSGNELLKGAYLECKTGEVVGVLGRNGAGKTTLLNIIFGAVRADQGQIRLDDKPIKAGYQKSAIRYLPQQKLFPGFVTCKACLKLFGVPAADFKSFFSGQKIDLNDRVSVLSNGLRKAFELFVILKSACKFVLLDEPFVYLSPLQTEEVLKLILQEKYRKGIILTDHRYREVLEVSDRCWLLEGGNLLPIQSSSDLIGHGYIHE